MVGFSGASFAAVSSGCTALYPSFAEAKRISAWAAVCLIFGQLVLLPREFPQIVFGAGIPWEDFQLGFKLLARFLGARGSGRLRHDKARDPIMNLGHFRRPLQQNPILRDGFL